MSLGRVGKGSLGGHYGGAGSWVGLARGSHWVSHRWVIVWMDSWGPFNVLRKSCGATGSVWGSMRVTMCQRDPMEGSQVDNMNSAGQFFGWGFPGTSLCSHLWILGVGTGGHQVTGVNGGS